MPTQWAGLGSAVPAIGGGATCPATPPTWPAGSGCTSTSSSPRPGAPPHWWRSPRSLGLTPSQTERILQQLASQTDALVLLPGSAHIWMAEPFSAVPTSFLVGSGTRRWWGNCIWDALAILALLRLDGWVQTACPDCGADLRLDVAGDRLSHHDGVVHVAVPARDWWRSIGFT